MSYFMFITVIITAIVAGIRGCDPMKCPRLPCNEPVKLPGQCCPYCPCKYDGAYYNIGDLVFTDDPCVTCECSKYGVDCLPYPCPPTDCLNPILVEGSCCPECGCLVGDTVYDLGYQVYTRNPCEECRCEYNGQVVCTKKSCPSLQCSNPIKIRGECCRECGCKGNDRVIYSFGPIEPVDQCRPCICNGDGTITCQEPECPVVTCPKRNQYTPEGKCCPRCSCNFQGAKLYEGDPMPIKDVCTTQCRCGPNGERVCEYEVCPQVTCNNPVSVPGKCCPVCGCLDGKGRVQPFGSLQTDDKCEPCACNINATITCQEPECPEVKCDGKRKYTPVDKCCPKCRCFFKSIMYNPGDEMPINVRDPCVEVCHCGDDGYEYCNFTVCPLTDCEQPVIVPGQCCPQCGCVGKNKTLIEFGPIQDDPCQECECTKTGNITCGRKHSCPKVSCVSGLYKPTADDPKECCGKCRCKFGGKFYKPGEMFEGPRCQECECRAFTGRVYCEKANCSHVQLKCPNPTYKEGDCCPSCPDGPSCTAKKSIIQYGSYKTVGKQVCTCLGDPWFPNAFCAPATVSKALSKKNRDVWSHYGYPELKEPSN